jgi:transcriptional regulator with XRE-family HTH domain
MKKFELYRQERKEGLTYREIAEKYGVSYQVVAQACGKSQPNRFRFWTKDMCIYPNVRKWLNENKITYRELQRRLGWETCSANYIYIGDWLRGKTYPRKKVIDKLLSATGLTYEKFFETEKKEEI